jgi:hypothetical protein
VCSKCHAVLFEGPLETVPPGLLHPGKQPCGSCGGLSRRVELTVEASVQVDAGVRLGVGCDTPHSSGHRMSRDLVVETRVGGDGRRVRRTLDLARDHDPPFKWHLVVDADTDEVIKNELIDFASERIYDFRDPSVPVPSWFGDPRAP